MNNQLILSLYGDGSEPAIFDALSAQFVLKNRLRLEELLITLTRTHPENVDKFMNAFNLMTESIKADFLLHPKSIRTLLPYYSDWNDATVSVDLFQRLNILQALAEHLHDDKPKQFSCDSKDTARVEDEVSLESFTVCFESEHQAQKTDFESGVYHTLGQVVPEDERRQILMRIERALLAISSASPNFYYLIRTFTRFVNIRKNTDSQKASEENPEDIGRIHILNTHLMSDQDLIEAILHESVHNFLTTFEYTEYNFIHPRLPAYAHVRPVSLWSGKPIQAAAFIHAVFVYFALFNLVRLQLHGEDTDVHTLNSRYHKFASGFLYPGKISHYVSYACAIDRRIASCLDGMQAVVQGNVGL